MLQLFALQYYYTSANCARYTNANFAYNAESNVVGKYKYNYVIENICHAGKIMYVNATYVYIYIIWITYLQ